MNFDNSYFEDEVRDGFYVPGIMKRLWAAQLEILEDVDRICKKYNIMYFADMGTLLGTIRHKGYIPWDDDMDICMKRNDYNKFIKVALNELPDNYSLLNIHNDPEYNEMFTRILNTRSYRTDREFLDKFHEFPYSSGIDIFPMDYIAPNEEEDRTQIELIRQINKLISLCSVNNDDMHPDIREKIASAVKQICNVDIDVSKPIRQQLMILNEKLYSIYTEQESKEITLMPFWVKEHRFKYPKGYYDGTVLMPYENTAIPVPIMYDAILRLKYGFYMNIVKKWDFHEYPVYKRQEDEVEQVLGKLPNRYYIEKNTINQLLMDNTTDCTPRHTVKGTTIEMITLLIEAIKQIANYLESDNREEAMELLVQSQEYAIEIGTMLENMAKEAIITDAGTIVNELESFCESIYNLYQDIDNSFNQTEAPILVEQSSEGHKSPKTMYCSSIDIVEKQLTTIRQLITDTINEKKIIVFMPYKATSWQTLDSIYENALKDDDSKVYVVPIPYYYKNFDGECTQMKFSLEEYPDKIKRHIVKYDEFDFEKYLIDTIIYNNPYDQYNDITTVHPSFYSTNLRNYANTLIYVPYFETDEIEDADERSYYNMRYYCNVPGVINADKIIVQSDNTRKAYIKSLIQFTDERTKNIWEKKLVTNPQACKELTHNKAKINEQAIGETIIPYEWTEKIYDSKGNKKKVMLYSVNVSMIIEYSDAMIEKIKRVLSICEDNKDRITLLWYENPYNQDALEAKNPKLCRQYKNIVAEYISQGWGIYDNSGNITRAISISDAYYGDPDYAVQASRRKGIPVMIENVEV